VSGTADGDGLEIIFGFILETGGFVPDSLLRHLRQSYCVQGERSFALVLPELKVEHFLRFLLIQSFGRLCAYRRSTPISVKV
jgi:hypothetical protein